jgi:hypothetical protein
MIELLLSSSPSSQKPAIRLVVTELILRLISPISILHYPPISVCGFQVISFHEGFHLQFCMYFVFSSFLPLAVLDEKYKLWMWKVKLAVCLNSLSVKANRRPRHKMGIAGFTLQPFYSRYSVNRRPEIHFWRGSEEKNHVSCFESSSCN